MNPTSLAILSYLPLYNKICCDFNFYFSRVFVNCSTFCYSYYIAISSNHFMFYFNKSVFISNLKNIANSYLEMRALQWVQGSLEFGLS